MKDYILSLDKPRKLKFGFKATRLINEKFKDRDLSKLVEFAQDEFIYLAWAGLIWEDESLTEEKVEELLDATIGEEYSQTDIATIVADAMTAHSGAAPVKKKVGGKIPSKKRARPPSK